MKMMSLLLTCAVCLAVLQAGAQTLDGSKIHMKSGKAMSLNVPLSLPCDAKTGDDVVTVLENATGKTFPATVRNGELVFISEGAMPNTEHNYTVKVQKKDVPNYAPHVLIKKQEGKEILDVLIDDVLFTRFYYSHEFKKPFLWPINSEGQVTLTRDYPMDPACKPQDHPHHKSLWSAFGDVNGSDCWAEGADSGFQVSGEPEWGSGDAYGWIAVKDVWQDKDHKPLITEAREYRFYTTPEKGRLLDVAVTFSADYGDVTFKDTKEGGIVAVRMREELCGVHANITNADGDKGEKKAWGKPSPWCDYSGELPNAGWRGLTIFDNPANLRYPTSWHVRDYGLMGANCFGWSYFAKEVYNKGKFPAPNGDWQLKSGQNQLFKYRVYVHSGDVEKAAVADRFADYATPPQVAWAK